MSNSRIKIIQDDNELVGKLQNPETCRKAFEEVICRYSEPLYWQIRRLVNNHDDANDLLQNTFMKAWSAIDSFRGSAKLSTWLYKIAINESLTFINNEKKHHSVSLDGDESGLIKAIESDTFIDGDNLKKELRKAIASLPEKQRIVFNMRYYDDMKYEAMSEILGTSVGALKASYHHAVKKIEEYFSDYD